MVVVWVRLSKLDCMSAAAGSYSALPTPLLGWGSSGLVKSDWPFEGRCVKPFNAVLPPEKLSSTTVEKWWRLWSVQLG